MCGSLATESELEYVELWELPAEADSHAVRQELADAFEAAMPALQVAGIKWRGAETVVVSGQEGRATVILLQPLAADHAVTDAFLAFFGSGDPDLLARAADLADEISGVTRAFKTSLWQRLLLSAMLSKSGFLKAFDDQRLADAERDLLDALDLGPGDGWVTHWNLANVLGRQQRYEEAHERLARVGEEATEHDAASYLVFYVPGKQPIESMLKVGGKSLDLILRLQRAVFDWERGQLAPSNLRAVVKECPESNDDSAVAAAGVEAVLTELQPGRTG